MGYQYYQLKRPGLTIVFDDTPPAAEGFYDAPRQSIHLQQVERGTVNLDYGVDPANKTLKLTFEVVPEFIMKYWEGEYNSLASVDTVYQLVNHRNVSFNVKWKSFHAVYLRTLAPYDVEGVLPQLQYVADAIGVTLENDPDHLDIADLYKVEMEFFNVPDSLFT